MSSDDIIRHIIRDITARSSGIIKARRARADAEREEAAAAAAAGIISGYPRISPSGAPTPMPPDGDKPRASVARTQSLAPPQESSQPQTQAIFQAQQAAAAPPAPKTPLPEDIRHIFMAGIQSHVAPSHVTETLAAFMIRAIVLDPLNGFRIEQELSRDEVDRLIELCIEKITATDDPVQETVRMQVYFDTNFPAQNDFLHKEKLTRIDACSSLLKEILDVKSKSISAYENLYRKIVSYVLLRTHVGNATDVRVVREATAALESVFPQSELNAFVSLSRGEKEAQLNGLAQLVTGIRLFNKQLGKGGESIEKLPELCASELRELTILLHEHTQRTEQLVQQYKAALDYADSTPNSEIHSDFANRIRAGLVFRRQYLIYLDALQEQVMKSRQTLVSIGERFDDGMRELKMTCKSKTAVPVDQVYPQFIMLSNLWSNWTDELFLLAFRRGIVDQLDFFARSFSIEISPLVDSLIERYRADIEPEILPESEVITKAATTMTTVAMINKTVEVVHPGNTTQYYKLPVEYGGFCAYSLITRSGLVVPGDKNLGMIRYKDRLFAFANLQAVAEFSKLPERYMEAVVELAKRQPGLVQLLHLYNYFPTVEALERARSYTRQRLLGQMPMVAEMGCQVDTHIVDAHMNLKYRWNEWDLRRQALMLVNLKDKRTHSTQTDLSHFRRESETQYYQLKSNTAQTKRTSNTNVPRTVVYYAGLRNSGEPLPRSMYAPSFGPREHHFRTVDLSIDHDGGPVPYGGGAFRSRTVMPPISPSKGEGEANRPPRAGSIGGAKGGLAATAQDGNRTASTSTSEESGALSGTDSSGVTSSSGTAPSTSHASGSSSGYTSGTGTSGSGGSIGKNL
ncbi:hypothetical protein HK105_206759 [Polyrhizophydium stewartii]|uniref:Cilia- and flagella-associated protein 206 n=1 Tax=Polyrhizophydium stewartii TaxID=2732419 RepID=A0ABR4N2Q2_9FUNG